MEGAETLDAREYADADALVSAAAAAASAGDGTVTLTNLRVTHRKRRGAKQFWVTAAAMGHGTFEVQMSFRRADLDDAGRTGDAAMRWETEAHAAAFEAATPGAVITLRWGHSRRPADGCRTGTSIPRRVGACGAARRRARGRARGVSARPPRRCFAAGDASGPTRTHQAMSTTSTTPMMFKKIHPANATPGSSLTWPSTET